MGHENLGFPLCLSPQLSHSRPQFPHLCRAGLSLFLAAPFGKGGSLPAMWRPHRAVASYWEQGRLDYSGHLTQDYSLGVQGWAAPAGQDVGMRR